MMKLYIGGAYQGQEELARSENPGAEIFADFHENLRTIGEQDPRAFAQTFCLEHPDAVVVANEVGSGVVPMTKEDRAFRENVGRALCVIAREAERVIRVVCGIGVRIK